MNKLISTLNRVFMCIAGPSGSGKTQLIYSMLRFGTFQPDYSGIIYFYRHWQPIYDMFLADVKNIEFVQTPDFDLIDSLNSDNQSHKNTLLIFDDVCEEILSNERFSNLSTSGRHKHISVIFIKHNLFQQGKYSVTVDKNTTHIILMKNTRLGRQLKILGSDLGNTKFLEDCYNKAVTTERFGHLLIDLTPYCIESLRYCSGVGDRPSFFWLPSKHARITTITDEETTELYAKSLQQTL